MTPRLTTDDPNRVIACPECDYAGEVYERTHRHKDYAHAHRCHDCGAEFDDPVERNVRDPNTDPPTTGYATDGLPLGLDPSAKSAIRAAREGGD